MPTKKTTGKKLADMMYGTPEGAAFGVFPQMGKRGQSKPTSRQQLEQIFADERAMDLPKPGDVDLSVPTPANRAMSQRMAERDVDLKRQADEATSPLEKLAGGMQTGRLLGSGMLQAVKSIPTAITKGGQAAEDYIAENIYKPNQPKAYEYAQDIGDFLTSLETDYKIPPILPEAMALQSVVGPATQQAQRGALTAGMNLERRMEPIVNRALEGGGLPREMVQAMGANTQSNVVKPKAAANAPIKASEALGRIEGRPLVITQTDRTKVGDGFLGGPGFSSLQLTEPEYRAASAAWGVKTPGVAKMILGGGKKAGDDAVYTTFIGSPTQHQSNQMVFDKLYGDFKKSAKKGGLDPELQEKINYRLANSVDKDGKPIFPPDVDILNKNFKDLASTFDQRAVTSNLIGGMGVGGKKGQIIDYDKIIRNTTDPALLDSPSGALGNRLFTLDGGVINRPDLHPAFPTILQGEDLGVSFEPVVRELVMKDFIDKTMREKGRAPGYMDYTRGYPPSQIITEDILTEMQKLGLKKGGAVKFSDNPDAMQFELAGGGLVKKIAKAAVKGAQEALPAVEREANLQRMLEPSKVKDRLYHGTTATEGGKGEEAFRRIKPSKDGALGSGVYLTPNSSRASGYAESPFDSKLNLDRHSPNVLPVYAQIRNPLIIDGAHADPMIEALTKLGMDENSARKMVERAYDQKGYIGKEVQSRAQAQGYDGLMQYHDNNLSEVVSYNPSAVKSATGNQGTYDLNNPDLSKAKGGAVQFSDNLDAMRLELAGGGLVKSAAKAAAKGLVSAVDKTAQNLKRPMGTGKEFMAEIRASSGIKSAEIKGRNLAEIEAMPKMSKDKFIKELEARPPVKIEEKVLGQPSQKEIDKLADELAYQKGLDEAREFGKYGDDIDAMAEENYLLAKKYDFAELQQQARETLKEGDGGPFHEEYTIPGGENYREILLKMPENTESGYTTPNGAFFTEQDLADPSVRRIAAKVGLSPATRKVGNGFPGNSAHFGGEPNILASIRVSDRTGPNSEKILHVEEIQSDWHQKGRKQGYKQDLSEEDKGRLAQIVNTPNWSSDEKMLSDFKRLNDKAKSAERGVPDAPFKKDWQELALRRVMQEAAEGGYDRVALTKGAEQAARYDLSKQISRVEWKSRGDEPGKLIAYDKQGVGVIEKEMSPDELSDNVGKDVAEKLLKSEVSYQTERGHDIRQLSGLDLKVGGEGMSGFYDKMLPDYLNKLGKQYGVEVGEVDFSSNPSAKQLQQGVADDALLADLGVEAAAEKAPTFHSFQVTPQMREDINTKGQPLYSKMATPAIDGLAAGTGAATMAPEVFETNNEQQVQNPVHFTENPDAMLLELMQRN